MIPAPKTTFAQLQGLGRCIYVYHCSILLLIDVLLHKMAKYLALCPTHQQLGFGLEDLHALTCLYDTNSRKGWHKIADLVILIVGI